MTAMHVCFVPVFRILAFYCCLTHKEGGRDNREWLSFLLPLVRIFFCSVFLSVYYLDCYGQKAPARPKTKHTAVIIPQSIYYTNLLSLAAAQRKVAPKSARPGCRCLFIPAMIYANLPDQHLDRGYCTHTYVLKPERVGSPSPLSV